MDGKTIGSRAHVASESPDRPRANTVPRRRRSEFRLLNEAFARHADEFSGDPFPSFLETLLYEQVDHHPQMG